MPYVDRYIKKPINGDNPNNFEWTSGIPDAWVVYDTHAKQTLLGSYSEDVAARTCIRLNADINLSPNLMRALNTLLAVRTLSAHKLYEQFTGRTSPGDATDDGKRIARQLEEHGLVKQEECDGVSLVHATDFAYLWSGRAKPDKE